MRTDSARLAAALVICGLLAGCQSNWDWWRSSKKSSPGASTLASAPPAYQPALPSAAAQPGGNAYNGLASYPNTGYPTGPAGGGGGATLSTTSPGGAYPPGGNTLAKGSTTPAWPTPGGGAGASPYPNPTGLAQTQPPVTAPYAGPAQQPAMAAQVGPYNSGAYAPPADAMAKGGPAGATGLGNNRYPPTGDRFAMNNSPTAPRYDVPIVSPPDRGTGADRYPLNSQGYGALGTTPPATPMAGSTAGPTGAGRYLGTGADTKPVDYRSGLGDNLAQAGAGVQPSAYQSGVQPAGAPPVGPADASKSAPGEFQPGSIKRLPTGAAGQQDPFAAYPALSATGAQPATGTSPPPAYPPTGAYPYNGGSATATAPPEYPPTSTPAAGHYQYPGPGTY